MQLIYISPECIPNNVKYRRMLTSEIYVKNLVALVVEEEHCIKIWGDSFRLEEKILTADQSEWK